MTTTRLTAAVLEISILGAILLYFAGLMCFLIVVNRLRGNPGRERLNELVESPSCASYKMPNETSKDKKEVNDPECDYL